MRSDAPKPGGCLDRLALSVLAVLLVLSVVSALAGSAETWRTFVSALATGLLFVIGRTSLRLDSPWPVRWIGIAGAVAAAVSLASLLLVVWLPSLRPANVGASEEALARLAGGSGAIAMLVADAGFLHGFRLRRMIDRAARLAALLALAILAVLALVMCLSPDPTSVLKPLFSSRTFPAWVIFTAVLVFTHLATPMLGRMEIRREQRRRETAPDRALLTLQCPRCSLWMQMHSGLVSCPGCRLPLRVEFDEPRCACGYPLHRLQGECCPECGRGIPAEQRWGRGRPTAPPVAQPPQPPPPAPA